VTFDCIFILRSSKVPQIHKSNKFISNGNEIGIPSGQIAKQIQAALLFLG